MTKAKSNIATAPAPLKFEHDLPEAGLSIADAHRAYERLSDESEKIDLAHRDSEGTGLLQNETQQNFNFWRTEALLGLIETTLANTPAEALVQIDRIEALVDGIDMEHLGEGKAKRELTHIRLMLESIARILAQRSDKSGVDGGWARGYRRQYLPGYIPHMRVVTEGRPNG